MNRSVPDRVPTLETVAAAAGVSRQTVSNALRHPHRVSPRTRDHVLRIISETGYRPSLPARQLATRRAQAIAVRAEVQQDQISGLVLDAFYHGLAEAGHRIGMGVRLYPVVADAKEEVALVTDLVRGGAVDAVVLTATTRDDVRAARLLERQVPLCSFGRPWHLEDPPHDWVDIDGAQGTRLAVRHLASRGFRRIGFLGWPDDQGTGDDRRRGWAEALGEVGQDGPAPEARCPNEIAAASAAASRLLAGTQAPDALVCASDTLAVGAYRADRERRLPADQRSLGVVGFDATAATAVLGVASVRQPVAQAASACLDLLSSRLAGQNRPPRSVLLAPSLAQPP